MLRTLRRLKISVELLYRRHNLLIMNNKKSKNDEGSVWDFLAGLVMGFVGYGILSEFANRKHKCPVCMTKVKQGQASCHVCKNQLRWN